MRTILDAKPGTDALLLGNEAIARGAIEAGIKFASTYPGTPASEIGDSIAQVADGKKIYFEYSANEKVALEGAFGASLSGCRAITSMKHVGMNVAADALLSLTYLETTGGLLIVSADDPGCYSSQNEQDNRFYARFAGIPMLEPSSAQECLKMARESFELSEKLSSPVMLRTTTRISHTRGIVRIGEIQKISPSPIQLKTKPLVVLPSLARKGHVELLEKLRKAEELSDLSQMNKSFDTSMDSDLGIVCSSAGFNYAMEACLELSADVDVLKIGFSYPLPKNKLTRFLTEKKKVLIVEELEPIMENEIRSLSNERKIGVEIFGKNTGHLPRTLDYSTEIVTAALNYAFFDEKPGFGKEKGQKLEELPPRSPVLCPGCPHAATYYAIEQATKGKAIFTNDIGCYSLGVLPPINIGDIMLCMGASIGIAGGISRAQEEKVIAFIGDSTFFHTGLPGLINAVHNKHGMMIVILDNKTTAMTGHQPHPGSDVDAIGEEAQPIILERVIEGCGVDEVRIIDPYDVKVSVAVIKEELSRKNISVIISRRACALLEVAERGSLLGKRREIDQNICEKCGICVDAFMCPAICREDDVYRIDPVLCVGCGVCDQICSSKAIRVKS